jgi:phasin family protein
MSIAAITTPAAAEPEVQAPVHATPPTSTNPADKGTAMPQDHTYETFTAAFAPFGYDKLFGSSKEQMEKFSANAFKAYEDLSAFSKGNYDAYVTASTIMAKGAETIGKTVMQYTKESLETGAQTAMALLGTKTLREAVDLNTDFAKQSFDKMVAEGTKLSEMTIKVSNEAFEPISARFNVAVEKMLKPMAV